jgi:hypothetical protein
MNPHPIELQHINVKLLLKDSEALDLGRDLDPIIPIFHNWIQEQSFDELLLDVADYRHVQGGPGILLIGHEADYSVDNTDNRPGVRYNRKAIAEGTNQDRLAQAALAALGALQRIKEDARLNGKLSFNGHEVEIFVNDRALAPNSVVAKEALQAEFQEFSRRLFGGSEFSLAFGDDPRRLFGVSVKAGRAFTVGELIENLKAGAESQGKHAPSSVTSDHDLRERLEVAQGAD